MLIRSLFLYRLDVGSSLGNGVNFFIYDVIKILALIFAVVTVINFIRTFFEPKQIKESVKKLRGGLKNITATLSGEVTPFHS